MNFKKASDSHTVMSEIVLLSATNGSGRLFGGQIMSWMDIAGAICAKRHSGCEVVTVSVDHLSFVKPRCPRRRGVDPAGSRKRGKYFHESKNHGGNRAARRRGIQTSAY